MIINEGKFNGVFEIQLEAHDDERGFFMRVYDDKIFRERGIHHHWVQENQSLSRKKSVARGLHFQFPPCVETKLVRVVSGKIFDVFLDLRKGSKTFGQWDSIELSAENKRMIYIPRGFAHGFCTLSEDCNVVYKVDNYYSPETEGTIRWNDPQVGINWPVSDPIISKKDSEAPSLQEFIDCYGGLEV